MGGTGTTLKHGPGAGLRRVFADLHLHIGSTGRGEPVKISASRALTFRNIAHEAACRKGIRLLGVIDAHSPGVQRDIAELLDRGEMAEAPGGGIRYRDVTLLLGTEIEVKEPGRGPAHHLVFLRDFEAMRSFTDWLKERMTNVGLSSQRIRASGPELQRETAARGGLFIPAHIFTPHRSLYGSCTDRLSDVLDPDLIDAVELGLSADTAMAGLVPELDRYPFLTNSDAHSLARIGREYNSLILGEPSFDELRKALRGEDGRGIAANYGLDPRLGKYHRTHCAGCGTTLDVEDGEMPASPDAVMRCPLCGSAKLIRGVSGRVRALGRLAGRNVPRIDAERPPYICQVPLEFIPGVGPKLLDRLLDRFGTEMNVLHEASPEALAETAGEKAAALILAAREGRLDLQAGGGGRYGKALSG
ncbi:hypothetical protein Theco_1943 [Thermobacillus composti KWC4]|uniref:TIGR00375 family protein n=1 Tax=Thermobacillus composti (strain DSM 18247 / JCM 13945 / KWC4) TaxID=717605 RepID=L0EFY4_THECK|nr:endonuclease Q family protein [Thermobacillus composti]AGA58065.1 hypothetical protein Theco_1943 [Thermobacillus composti KWC4]